jgi:hypothetical protein
MSTPRDMQVEVPQVSALSPTVNKLVYLTDPPPPKATGVNLDPSTDDICLYATEHKECYVLRKFQHMPSSMAASVLHTIATFPRNTPICDMHIKIIIIII